MTRLLRLRAHRPLALTILLAAGCDRPAMIELIQPQLAAPEQRLQLSAQRALYRMDAQLACYLVEIPLPGSTQGRQYELYIRLPPHAGEHLIGDPLPAGGFAAGFFIQLSGRNRGLAELTGGQVRVSDVPLSTSAERRLDVDLRCGDGTRLSGSFIAEQAERRVAAYERSSADVQHLIRAAIDLVPASAPAAQPDHDE